MQDISEEDDLIPMILEAPVEHTPDICLKTPEKHLEHS